MSRRGGKRCVRLVAFVAVAIQSAATGAARAAEAWPSTPPDTPEWLARDQGGGLALVPLALWWALVAGWAATSAWVFRDAARFKIRPEFWIHWAVFPFAACALLAWWVPWSAVGLLVMVVGWMLPLLLYARERNPKAPASESIFTRSHAERTWKAVLRRMGVKVAADAPISDGLPWVKFSAPAGATPAETAKALRELEEMEGYQAATKLLQEAAAARATTIVIEPAADGLRVGHEVDGISAPSRGVKTPAKGRGKAKQPEIWADAPPLPAAVGNAALAVLRKLAGGDAAKTAGEKEAAFTVEVDGKKKTCRLSTRATKTSKQVVVAIDTPAFVPKKLEDLGMSPDLANRVRELIALEKGLFVVSSPPGTGCSTTFDTVLLSADRLLRDFVSIEDSAAPAKEIQNVKPVRYSKENGETPVTALKAAMLEYPRAVVTRDLADAELAARLMDLADEQQFVLVSLKAADAIDAIQKLVAMGIPRDQLARCLLGSLCQRLVRKLCDRCADPVPTPPKLLQQFKKTAEELPEIKRPSPHGGCRACAGRQFVGRTAIFELAAGPTLRQAIAQEGDAKLLRQAAVKDGMRPLMEEGLGLVAVGSSAVEEMQRVFAAKKEAGPAGVRR